MSKVCSICGKGSMKGNLVSKHNNKTNCSFNANLQKVTIEQNGKTVKANVCAKCLKTAKKDA